MNALALLLTLLAAQDPTPQDDRTFQAAVLRLRSGNYERAEGLLTQVVEATPDRAIAWALLGSARLKLERYEDAESALRRALELDPAIEGVRFDLGASLYHQTRYEEALAEFREFLTVNSESAHGNWMAAMTLLRLDRPAEAVTPIRNAIRIDPERYAQPGEYFLAQIDQSQGNQDEARGRFEEAARLNPESAIGQLSAREAASIVEEAPRESEWSGEVGAAVAMNDNATLNGRNANLPDEVSDERSYVVTLTGRIGFTGPIFGDGILQAQYDAFQTLHGTTNEFNLHRESIRLQTLWPVGEDVRAGPFASFSYDLVDGRGFANYAGVGLMVQARLSENSGVMASYAYTHREFLRAARPAAMDVEGNLHVFNVSPFIRFPDSGAMLNAGVSYSVSDVQGREYQYGRWDLSAGVTVPFEWDTQVSLNVAYGIQNHWNRSIFDATHHRADRQWTASMGIMKPLGDHWRIGASVSYADNQSNIARFGFRQVVYGLSVAYSF